MLKTIAGAAVLLVSVSAYAADHPQPLGVWDSEGTLMGNYLSEGAFETVINGTRLGLPFLWNKIPEGLELVYTQPNCQGQGYIQFDQPLKPGGVLDGTIYYPGAAYDGDTDVDRI
jgi:hypothetical protein